MGKLSVILKTSILCIRKTKLKLFKQSAIVMGPRLFAKYEVGDTDVLRQKLDYELTSDLEIKNKKALFTQSQENRIHKILENENYTFDDLLVILNPFKITPVTALVLFKTEQKCRVKVIVKGETKEDDMEGESDWATKHRVPVFGLYPQKVNQVLLKLYDEQEQLIDEREIKIKTQRLPVFMNDVVHDSVNRRNSAYPFIFVTGGGEIFPFAFDREGSVRFFFKHHTTVYGAFPLKNGRYLLCERNVLVPTYAHPHACEFHEVDMLGRIYKTYYVENGVHHFATELPNGNIVTVSNSLEGHTEDIIIEINRSTGEIEQTIDMEELFGSEHKDMTDWAHVNYMQYDEAEHTMILCLRNVHAIIKFNWMTKEVLWILSVPEFWEKTGVKDKVLQPIGEVPWHYQAHAGHKITMKKSEENDVIHIIVFDNHRINRRRIKGIKEGDESYITIYAVNEAEKTVALQKQFAVPISLVRSNAVYDEESNRIFAMEGCLRRKEENNRGSILELDYDTGEMISSCYIKWDFFSAYPFKVDSLELSKPADLKKTYSVQALEGPDLLEKIPEMRKNKIPKQVIRKIYIKEDILYLRAQDHVIKKVYFVGENYAYMKDYTKTHQTMDRFSNKVYFHLISCNKLKEDTYSLYCEYEDKIYSIGKYIRIDGKNTN